MKVRGKTSCAGVDFSLSLGEVADLPEATASALIKAGHAEPADDDAPPARTAKREKAVRAAPEKAVSG